MRAGPCDAERTDTGEPLDADLRLPLRAAPATTATTRATRPTSQGIDRFRGEIVHPQHWPEDLDYDGKRVVVIGSGATAVTLLPSMAERAAHVTMLQRSPSYVVSLPGKDGIAVPCADVLPREGGLRDRALEERAAADAAFKLAAPAAALLEEARSQGGQ